MAVALFDARMPLDAAPVAVAPKKGLWRRAFDRLIEARMRQAQAEIDRQNTRYTRYADLLALG